MYYSRGLEELLEAIDHQRVGVEVEHQLVLRERPELQLAPAPGLT